MTPPAFRYEAIGFELFIFERRELEMHRVVALAAEGKGEAVEEVAAGEHAGEVSELFVGPRVLMESFPEWLDGHVLDNDGDHSFDERIRMITEAVGQLEPG